jgi:hypothetical protein
MSELIGAQIRFDYKFSQASVAALLDAIYVAAEENWAEFRDEWSSPQPEPPLVLDRWFDLCSQNKMEFIDYFDEPGFWRTRSLFEAVPFSPLSFRAADLSFNKLEDGDLRVIWLVSDNIQWEYQGDREIHRVEEIWREIRSELGEPPLQSCLPIPNHPDYEKYTAPLRFLQSLPSVGPQNVICARRVVRAMRSIAPVKWEKTDQVLQ